jgi:hypothetical protein
LGAAALPLAGTRSKPRHTTFKLTGCLLDERVDEAVEHARRLRHYLLSVEGLGLIGREREIGGGGERERGRAREREGVLYHYQRPFHYRYSRHVCSPNELWVGIQVCCKMSEG